MARRTHGDSGFSDEGHDDHEEVRPFDGPPKAARRDVRERKYKPPIDKPMRFVFAFPYIAAVDVLRTPTNRTASTSVRLRELRSSV